MFRDVTAERRTEEQLRDAQRLLAVGTLAGGVAHEVNNALQGVLGFGSFVLGALGPEHPQAPDMRLVLQSAERAARVSQQLLAYTRQQVTRPEPVDLHALTTQLRPVLRQLLGADKSLTIAPAPAELPLAQADRSQVEQVLINLVANARDAMDTGGEVTIAFDRVEVAPDADGSSSGTAPLTASMGFRLAPGGYVQVSVSDTGHGMSAETLSHVFDPFFTTKPVGEGTGLGLSMVYGTVGRTTIRWAWAFDWAAKMKYFYRSVVWEGMALLSLIVIYVASSAMLVEVQEVHWTVPEEVWTASDVRLDTDVRLPTRRRAGVA